MTVNTTNITSGPYSGNDIADEFSYTFRVETKNQLVVYEDDVALTVDTDYTVAGIGDDAGGVITRVAGPLPTGSTWYIRSDYKYTQDESIRSQGAFFPEIHEDAFDKLTFLIQQLVDGIDRSLRLPDSYSGGASAELPTPEALKFVRWNSAADALENVEGTTSVAASDVTLTPTGGIGSTNVQDAISELDTEKEPADASILKDADIGVNVQPYDADTTKNDTANTFTKTQTWTKGSDVASASALTLGDGNYFDITGTATVTSITSKGVGTTVKLHFDAALTLTYNATSLDLPSGANITTAAGDEFEFTEYSAGNWRCTGYVLASGESVISSPVNSLQLCKAWVSFDGTGTVSIDSDYNVSSITDNAAGDYTVNFTNAMADALYSVGGTGGSLGTGAGYVYIDSKATGSTRVRHFDESASTNADSDQVSIIIFGN